MRHAAHVPTIRPVQSAENCSVRIIGFAFGILAYGLFGVRLM